MTVAATLTHPADVPKLTAGDVDLSALEYFDNPYLYYAHLRATQPVAPVKELNAWFLTGYQDV